VDDVRLKSLEQRFDPRQVPNAESVKVHPLLEWHAERTPLQFNRRDGTICPGFGLRANVHAEKRQIVASGETLELAARQGDTIHLVKAIGQECDTGRRLGLSKRTPSVGNNGEPDRRNKAGE
jgi:hypothetical protein